MSLDVTTRKYLRAAVQRQAAVDLLLKHRFTFEAVYLCGYVVECALKAILVERTPQRMRNQLLGSAFRGARGHDFARIAKLLRQRGCIISMEIAENLARVSSWTTSLRYDTGVVPLKDAELFVRSAREILQWSRRSV